MNQKYRSGNMFIWESSGKDWDEDLKEHLVTIESELVIVEITSILIAVDETMGYVLRFILPEH
jgi:hypothetical protein